MCQVALVFAALLAVAAALCEHAAVNKNQSFYCDNCAMELHDGYYENCDSRNPYLAPQLATCASKNFSTCSFTPVSTPAPMDCYNACYANALCSSFSWESYADYGECKLYLSPVCTITEAMMADMARQMAAVATLGIEGVSSQVHVFVINRTCAPPRQCRSNEYAAVPAGLGHDTVCAPLTECNASKQEYETIAPTATSDRQCATCPPGFHLIGGGSTCIELTRPVWLMAIPARLITLPDTAPVGLQLFNFSTFFEWPVRLSVERCTNRVTEGDCPLQLAGKGYTLVVARPLDPLADLTAQVTIRATRVLPGACDRPDATGGLHAGCYADLDLTLRTASFRSPPCPDDVIVYQNTPLPAAANWTAPQLPALVFSDVVVAGDAMPDDIFGVGSHTVTYTTSPLTLGLVAECRFRVVLWVGREVRVPQIGHIYREPAATHPGGAALDYLVDSTGELGAMPAPVLDVTLDLGIVLGVRPVGDAKFYAAAALQNIPFGIIFHADMRWCEEGVAGYPAPRPGALPNASLTRIFFSESGVRRDLDWSSVDSELTADGRCFRMRGDTARPLVRSELSNFETLYFIWSPPENVTVPRVRKRYLPVQPSQIVAELVPLATVAGTPAGILTKDPGPFLRLDDTEPPVLFGMPSDLSLTADPYTDRALATWFPPQVSDNIGAVVASKSRSGTNFTVKGSPYVVTYTATDLSRNVVQRSFVVRVGYEPRVREIRQTLTSNDNISTTVSEALGTYVARHYFVRPGFNTAWSSITVPTHNTTWTALDLVLEAPPGMAIAQEVRKGLRARVVVDLQFSLNGSVVPLVMTTDEGPGQDAFASITFENLVNLTTGQPAQLPLDFFTNDLLTQFDLVRGILVVRGSTVVTDGMVRKNAIHVRVNFPLGRVGAAGAPSNLTLQATPVSTMYVETMITLTPRELSTSAANFSNILHLMDIVPPVWTDPPPNATVTLPSNASTIEVSWPLPRASDDHLVSHNATSKLPFGAGVHRVTFAAYDADGNVGVCSFTVTVLDVTPPVLVCPTFTAPLPLDNVTGIATFLLVAGVNYTVGDNSGNVHVMGERSPAHELLLPATPPSKSFVLTATDDYSGLPTTCRFTVTTVDVTPPVFAFCGPSGEFTGGMPVLDLPAPSRFAFSVPWVAGVNVTDNVGVNSLTYSPAPGSVTLNAGSHYVTATARDAAGLTAVCRFKLSVLINGQAATADASSSSSSASSSASVIAGIAVPLMIILAVAVLVLVLRNRRQARAAQRPQDFNGILALLDDIVDEDAASGKVRPREIARGALRLVSTLGKGHFGSVSKGYLQEHRNLPGYLVAVKVLHVQEATAVDKAALLEEAALMAQFNHPHVTQLVGVVTAGDPLLVVLEYCEYGALSSYLGKTTTTELLKLRLAGDCADGVQYLHRKNCVHRDLAARNVLLNSELRAKIADFGMSRGFKGEGSEYYQSSGGGAIPVRWTAPEALESKKFNAATDCWAFGVLLFELWTSAATPYRGWANTKVWLEVQNGYRLPCPANCDAAVHAVMLRCWAADPTARPALADIAAYFRGRSATLEAAGAADSEAGERAREQVAAAAGAINLVATGDDGYLVANTGSGAGGPAGAQPMPMPPPPSMSSDFHSTSGGGGGSSSSAHSTGADGYVIDSTLSTAGTVTTTGADGYEEEAALLPGAIGSDAAAELQATWAAGPNPYEPVGDHAPYTMADSEFSGFGSPQQHEPRPPLALDEPALGQSATDGYERMDD